MTAGLPIILGVDGWIRRVVETTRVDMLITPDRGQILSARPAVWRSTRDGFRPGAAGLPLMSHRSTSPVHAEALPRVVIDGGASSQSVVSQA